MTPAPTGSCTTRWTARRARDSASCSSTGSSGVTAGRWSMTVGVRQWSRPKRRSSSPPADASAARQSGRFPWVSWSSSQVERARSAGPSSNRSWSAGTPCARLTSGRSTASRRTWRRRSSTCDLGAGLADDPAGLVAPVVPGATHREQPLVPDHLGHDLEADPREALRHGSGMDAGMPDVADREGGDQGKRLGPVDPGVARERRVAMATGAPTAPTVGSCGATGIGLAIDPHVRLLCGPKGVVHAVAPAAIERDALGGIGRQELGCGAIEEAGHVVGIRAVCAQQSMVAQDPEIARLGARRAGRFLERGVEVEALHLFALLAGFERAQQLPDLVLPEAREREVELWGRPEIGEETREEGIVPGARDLVQREPEESGLVHADVEPGDGHAREAQPAGGDETLVAADDSLILPSGEHGLDEPELAEAALQGIELVLADPARVGGIGVQRLDRDVLDGEGGEGRRAGHD